MKYNPETARQGDVYQYSADTPPLVWVVCKDGHLLCARKNAKDMIERWARDRMGIEHFSNAAVDNGSTFLYNCLPPSWED